jgi:hypothetical protein
MGSPISVSEQQTLLFDDSSLTCRAWHPEQKGLTVTTVIRVSRGFAKPSHIMRRWEDPRVEDVPPPDKVRTY